MLSAPVASLAGATAWNYVLIAHQSAALHLFSSYLEEQLVPHICFYAKYCPKTVSCRLYPSVYALVGLHSLLFFVTSPIKIGKEEKKT